MPRGVVHRCDPRVRPVYTRMRRLGSDLPDMGAPSQPGKRLSPMEQTETDWPGRTKNAERPPQGDDLSCRSRRCELANAAGGSSESSDAVPTPTARPAATTLSHQPQALAWRQRPLGGGGRGGGSPSATVNTNLSTRNNGRKTIVRQADSGGTGRLVHAPPTGSPYRASPPGTEHPFDVHVFAYLGQIGSFELYHTPKCSSFLPLPYNLISL